jgi:acetylornithine/N-succinyldiaminopimelate aminotransferase
MSSDDGTLADVMMPTYARSALAFERGEGAYLFTAEGQRYLDFAAGIAVNALGYAHPHLVETMTRQAGLPWHVSNLYRIPEGERLAARLAAASFAERVFFCNSGAEAVEGALKVARRYHHARGETARNRVIAFRGAFHGRTLTTLSAAGNPKYLEGFGPPSPGFDHVAFGNMNEVRAAVSDETAAILVEPVQGEGGVRAADADFLRGLRTVCDEFELLLLFDEVQCGMGRTGRLFAHQQAGVEPDIMALAKGLGSGFPIGAILANEKAAAGMTPGTHGTTFGGNPLAMAVGNAVLDVMLAEGFFDAVERHGERLRRRLEAIVARYPEVFEEVRGQGLMLGLRCREDAPSFVERLRVEGLLTVAAAENVVRLLPPLIIGEVEIEEATAMIERAARGLKEER